MSTTSDIGGVIKTPAGTDDDVLATGRKRYQDSRISGDLSLFVASERRAIDGRVAVINLSKYHSDIESSSSAPAIQLFIALLR